MVRALAGLISSRAQLFAPGDVGHAQDDAEHDQDEAISSGLERKICFHLMFEQFAHDGGRHGGRDDQKRQPAGRGVQGAIGNGIERCRCHLDDVRRK